jgi:hypothetical protein
MGASTPPFNPSIQGQTPGAEDPARKLIEMVMQASKGKQQLAQPVPAPLPPQGQYRDPAPPGAWQPAWGAARLMSGVSTGIQNAVAQHKKNEMAKAESFWNQLNTAIQSGNQEATTSLLSDPKSVKRAAKALNVDYLNPEKTDVWNQALQKVMNQQKQKDGAAHGLKQMFQHLIGKATQPQLSDDQKRQMAGEIQKKLPIMPAQPDPKMAAEGIRAEAELTNARANMVRATAEAKDKYDIRADKDGNVIAIDKSDPTKVIRPTDDNGNPVTSAPKVGQSAKVVSIGQVPYGVARNGKVVTPGDSDWSGADAKLFESAKSASAQSQVNTDRRASIAANVRAQAFAKTREYGVIDSDTGGLVMLSPEIINQSPGRYAPASQAIQVKNRMAIFSELDYTSGQVNKSIAELPETGFDAKARAQIAGVLRDTDPRSALSAFLNSAIADTLSDSQVAYVTGLVSLQESAMSLRSLAGMGQGSDQLRAAIVRMLPGSGTPSKKYAQRQMELFTGEVNALRTSLPKLGTGGGKKTALSSSEPPRPSNVPPNYVFDANGPKGAGWYKPK